MATLPSTPKFYASLLLAMTTLFSCGQPDDTATPGNTGGARAVSNPVAVDAGGTSGLSLSPLTWNWVPVDGAYCRNGSSTGIGINPNPNSDKLVILFEGGGACFDATTCQLNDAHFDAADFDAFAASNSAGAGLFDRALLVNPVKDWNFVYVPYCTGDVHAGNNPQGFVVDVGPQQFVGYVNVGLYLEKLRPLFPAVTQVLLTGVSAGGFGSLANYVQVARAFAPVPVIELDDSGPPMGAPYVAACLASHWIQMWNLDKTVLADCGADCSDPAQLLIGFQKHLAKTYADRSFALIDSTGDWVISTFFGFGSNDCSAFGVLSQATFSAGLSDVRTQMADCANFGSFVFTGAEHTSLLDGANFPARAAGTTLLPDYISGLLAGQVSNVGP
jgi:hypothetical protein